MRNAFWVPQSTGLTWMFSSPLPDDDFRHVVLSSELKPADTRINAVG